MAYIYGLVDSLQGKDQVGDGECVTLVKQYAHLGVTGTWKQGRKVFGFLNWKMIHRQAESKIHP
ncbi:TPA: BPSL0067 family protein [Salmonella enterica subsp. enterica serovar Birkenhead]|uniref:BPSL0067 family protein n=1 Tax=Salmonella enterica TaxID=28901 RepID=UPI000A36A2B4|nr:BPSL0067 family protein [Salmonella enterica]EBJ4219724.1 hypothetical protein [Salmonella enterica]EBN9759600.1 hypothetical protein [Salmonella enterica]EBY7193085.1 hypothetical protein [Salmonella enterica subsp. enterica serovar Birkenhead]ECS6293458.1 hypothetical protein [Salmonella enterica subsp. enterica serovar Birkenhead]